MNLIQWGRLILTKVKNNQFRSISIFMNISLICTCLYLYNQIQDTHNVVMQKTDELYDVIDYYQCSVDSLAQISSQMHKTNIVHKKATHNNTKVVNKRTHLSNLSFSSFRICKNVDRYLQNSFCKALDSYTGPVGVLITSMRRKYCTHSKHSTGNAIDINMNADGQRMLYWLISIEGINWLDDHGLSFYIEDRPNSKKLIKYKEADEFKEYVFENNHATGLHIHMYRE